MQPAPFLFQPKLVPKIWGGRRLASELGKALPPEGSFGESWEVSGHPGDETPAVFPEEYGGRTIPQLARELKEEFLGSAWRQTVDDAFPLLYKFIDAEDVLSVQVHPGDAFAREHEGDNGKTECWMILDSRPDSLIYRGFRPGTDLETFDRLLEAGRLEECLHSFRVKPGDVVFLPARTVHAIGRGILLAEMQQSSDVTYRVYDWNRLEDGKPRPLHVPQARQVMDFSPPGEDTVEPRLLRDLPSGGRQEMLVRCDSFVLERLSLPSAGRIELETPRGRFSILSVLGGSGEARWSGGSLPLVRGTTVMVPAALPSVTLSARDDLLVADAYLPA